LAEKAYVRESVVVAVLTSLVLAGLCALLAWALLSRLVRRPIQALVAHAERVGQGDFALVTLPRTQDEIATLSDEMNRMCERLKDARDRTQRETREREAVLAQLRHADRLKTVGTLASGIAHELGTPINVVEGHAQLARESEGVSTEVHSHLDVITRQCKRMATIIRQLLDVSRRGGSKAQSCNLPAVVKETMSMLQPLAKKAQVDLVVKGNGLLDTEFKAGIGPSELQQVLLNVVINSVHASPSGGSVEVELRRGSSEGDDPGTELGFLEVRDSGTGMDAETVDHIFEPFFTTKKEGDGTGLGLSVAYGIVRDADGKIDVKSEPGRGSTFIITLPLVGVS
jgi:signal transduction histidine kinase